MAEPTLEELSTAYEVAFAHYLTIGGQSALAPLASSRPSLLDAWADYMIARRRYERALLRSRRGVEEN